jgi:plastocyanin
MSISVVRIPLVALLTAIILGACGGSGSSGDDDVGTSARMIEVVNIAYSPQTLEIAVGDKVEWMSKDSGVHHTVTSGKPGDNGVPGVSEGKSSMPDGVFDGDLPDASSTFSFTFTESGTFNYFCQVHPSMVGKIIVR